MKKVFLFAATMLLAVSLVSAKEATEATTEVAELTQSPVRVRKVYSNSYDGYLNVRSQPTSKSKIVGRLSNGPAGAELLGVEGNWSRVRVNGVVGYVYSSHLQSTPTESVYINASAVVGEWVRVTWANGYSYTIYENGKYSYSDTEGGKAAGTWYLSGHNLVLKHSNGRITICSLENGMLEINGDMYDRP